MRSDFCIWLSIHVTDIAYGEKRRVELAMALRSEAARAAGLDEPMAGLSNTGNDLR